LFSCAKISDLLTPMKPATSLVIALWFLTVFASSLSSESGGNQPTDSSAQAEFSAEDFDWREIVPYLFEATALPGEQGFKVVLENSTVLRAYIRRDIRAECSSDKIPCKAKGEDSVPEEEVSKRIDEIVQEGTFHRHKTAAVEYSLAHQPFPFSEIAAVKSEKHSDAYFMLELADRSYTAAQVQAKYGAPYDTDIAQWYSVFKYRLDAPDYTSKAVFEIDPVDGAVIKIAISLKPKKAKKRR
jgi:hypothetical protein